MAQNQSLNNTGIHILCTSLFGSEFVLRLHECCCCCCFFYMEVVTCAVKFKLLFA